MLGYLVRVFYDYSSPTRASLGLGTYALRPQRDIAHGERASCKTLASTQQGATLVKAKAGSPGWARCILSPCSLPAGATPAAPTKASAGPRAGPKGAYLDEHQEADQWAS
mgnify:CR=1 FL=1